MKRVKAGLLLGLSVGVFLVIIGILSPDLVFIGWYGLDIILPGAFIIIVAILGILRNSELFNSFLFLIGASLMVETIIGTLLSANMISILFPFLSGVVMVSGLLGMYWNVTTGSLHLMVIGLIPFITGFLLVSDLASLYRTHGIYLIVIGISLWITALVIMYRETKMEEMKVEHNTIEYNLKRKISSLESKISKMNNLPLWEDGKSWKLMNDKIRGISRDKFEDQYYADSVFSAFKDLIERVKQMYKNITGKEEDGVRLMRSAFGFDWDSKTNQFKQAPVIPLDDLSNGIGRDIQEGYMKLFVGAVFAVRNPKAHANIEITEEEGLHLLYLASLLMNKLDRASQT